MPTAAPRLVGAGSTGEATRPLTEPHVPPGERTSSPPRIPGLRARPRPLPPARRPTAPTAAASLRPPREEGGGKTPPAPLPQHRAPRRPSGPGRAVIGSIPTPGLRRGAPLGARLRMAAAAGKEKAAAGPAQGPGTHLSPRRPRKRESSREAGSDRWTNLWRPPDPQ